MKKQIAVGGSAANPPHLGHLALIKALLKFNNFSKVMWIPSGLRHDKKGFVSPDHRVKMTQLTMENITDKKFLINLSDVYGENMPTIQWMEILQEQNPDTEIVWYTGVDSIIPQTRFEGKCEIKARWQAGEKLIKDFKFLIFPRAGFPHPSKFDIPLSNFKILDVELPDISSSVIRRLIAENNPGFENLVTDNVAEYIKEKQLYRKKEV